jgi:hypothetical protein
MFLSNKEKEIRDEESKEQLSIITHHPCPQSIFMHILYSSSRLYSLFPPKSVPDGLNHPYLCGVEEDASRINGLPREIQSY